MERHNKIGLIVKVARLQKQWSQTDLAKRLGVSRTYIQNVEKDDNPGLLRLQEVFRELNLTLTQDHDTPHSKHSSTTD